MNVNFFGTVYLTKTFLPHFLQRPEAHIVNISSSDFDIQIAQLDNLTIRYFKNKKNPSQNKPRRISKSLEQQIIKNTIRYLSISYKKAFCSVWKAFLIHKMR